jgi:hypothetical protein
LLLSWTSAALAAPPDEPIGDGHFGRVRLGWEGEAPLHGLGPVSLLLDNPDTKPHEIRAVVASGSTQVEATVTLAPGAKRRVPFIVPLESHRVSVALAEGSKLLASSEHTLATRRGPTILVVDGDPGSRGVASVVSGVACVAAALEEIPSELACLASFETIVVRHANPARAGEGVRGVLDDYVRAGGTIVVVPNPADAETRTFWEEIPGAPRASGSLLQEKRRGLGRVLLAPADPCAATPEALALSKVLALELDLTPRRIFPRFFTGEAANEAAHRAGRLLAAFFVLYFVVAGPGLARRLRGAPPARVVRAVAIVVVAFAGLAALLARSVRHQVSHVDAVTFVVVPEEGEALASTEVVVRSGGAAHESILLEGEDVSATAVQRNSPFLLFDYRTGNSPAWTPTSATTRRAFGRHAIAFEDLAVPTLGDVRVCAISRARDYRPLEASIEVDPVTGERSARVKNTSGRPLGTIAVYSWGYQSETLAARFPRGLEPGASAVAPIVTRTGGAPAQVGYPAGLGTPIGWPSLAPQERDGADPRYVLVAEDEPPLRATAKEASVRQRTWRIEAVAAPVSSVTLPGTVGLKVKPWGPGVVVTASSAIFGERRVKGWLPSAGTTIYAIGGIPVHSQEELDRAFSRIEVDGWVEISTPDLRYSVQVGPPVPPVKLPLKKGQLEPPPEEEE